MTSHVLNLLKKKIPISRRRAIINGMIRYPLREWMFSNATKQTNIVAREELFSNDKKYQVFEFSSKESVVISEPYNTSEEFPQFITDKIGRFILEKPYVAEVANAEIVGSTAVGFDEDGNIISETVMPTGQKRVPKSLKTSLPTHTLILKSLPSFRVPQVDTACSLVSCWPQNYYNWIMYCLTRVEGSEYYQKQTGRKPVLIIDSNPPKWKIESLKLLGYEPDDCLHLNRARIKVKRLVVPSFRNLQQVTPLSACHWLRQRIFSNLPDVENQKLSFSSRIYISRPKTAGRVVINEDAVLAALTSLGFVAYTLENMTFSDQVRLFSQAEIVVSPHGAGLTNIVFGNDLKVIELFASASANTPAYFLLAKALGFYYGCLTSNTNLNGKKQYEKFNGIMVDIAKLRDLVAKMLSIAADRKPVNTIY